MDGKLQDHPAGAADPAARKARVSCYFDGLLERSMFKPSVLFPFLEELAAAPKKSLSQNFLIDGNVLQKIVKVADIKPEDHVLEIGAGPGALTEALLKTGARVTAVEKDHLFAEALSRFEGLDVFEGDIRDFPFERLERPVKVVSNLPYHLTTPILVLLMPRKERFSALTLMVQEEVARRMTAKPASPGYGLLTLFLAFYSECSYAFKVSPNSFHPVPKVHSAIVQLRLRQPPPVDEEGFFRMLRLAFMQRRKMLRSSLRELYPTIEAQERPEALSLEEFVELYQDLSSSRKVSSL